MNLFTRAIAAALLTMAAPFSANAQSNSQIVCGMPYTVLPGDSLSAISARAYGLNSFSSLFEANASVIGNNPNLIVVGQQLDIPCGIGNSVPAATQTAEAELVVPETAEVEPEAAEAELAEAEGTEQEVAQIDENVVLTFNKASAPPFIINSGIVDPFLAEITEVTEGRVSFVDPAVVNRDPSAQFDLVTSGEVDGAYVYNGFLDASHPLLQLPMLPLMGGSAEQTAVALWRLHDDYLSQTAYFDDAQLLGFIAAPAAHIWRLNDAPVLPNQNVIDENRYPVPYFEGLDTRGPAVVREEIMSVLTAYDEESNGSLTFFLAHGAARAVGIWTPERTVTEVDYGLYTPTFSLILSNEAWARISSEDRKAIEQVSGERLASRSASWDAFDSGHRLHMLDTGLNVVKADAALLAELEAVKQARLAPWRAAADAFGVPAQEAIDAYETSLDALQDRLLFR